MNKTLWSLVVIGPLITSCNKQPPTHSHGDFFVSANAAVRMTHHEELVRLASLKLNDHFGQEMVPVDPFNTFGRNSQNPVVRGNYLTDLPAERRPEEFHLGNHHGVKDLNDITWNDSLQSVHFNRDMIDGQYLSTQENCERALHSMRRDARIFLSGADGNRTHQLNFLGHLSHSIQDSFSAGHIRRQNIGPYGAKRIVDICSYYPSDGHCNHVSNLESDNVWSEVWAALMGSIVDDGKTYNALKPSAQLAVDVTFEAWRLLFEFLKSKEPEASSIDAFMNGPFERFLKDPSQKLGGYFLCPEDLPPT